MKRLESNQVSYLLTKSSAQKWAEKTFTEMAARQKAGLPLLNSSKLKMSKLLETLEYPTPYKEERLIELILSSALVADSHEEYLQALN